MTTQTTQTQYPIYTEPTFRYYADEIATDRDGKKITMRLCEELVEGRWEAFYSIRKDRAAK